MVYSRSAKEFDMTSFDPLIVGKGGKNLNQQILIIIEQFKLNFELLNLKLKLNLNGTFRKDKQLN
jgi:hypothetical protein